MQKLKNENLRLALASRGSFCSAIACPGKAAGDGINERGREGKFYLTNFQKIVAKDWKNAKLGLQYKEINERIVRINLSFCRRSGLMPAGETFTFGPSPSGPVFATP